MSNPEDSVHERPSSIDLTLELERQLDDESLPPTSPADMRPQSLDPQVLAHIITGLRLSLSETTRHRDELAKSISEIQTREKDLVDTLAYMTDKCSQLQEQLDSANNRARDDENSISLLRTKVEESRRGLMRLQSESRRHSQVPSPLDLSRASLVPPLGGPQASKRASFVPSTGRINAHRRISSVSDTGFARFEGGSPHGSPGPTNLTFPDNATNRLGSLPRSPGSFGRVSTSPPSVFQSEESVEVEVLRKELSSVRAELDETKHELSEANEAREASELCVKALRGFIEENYVGPSILNGGGSLGTQTSSLVEPKKVAQATVGGGWGFKLWRTESLAKNPPGAMSIPVVPSAIMPNNVSSLPSQPLSKKLGDFFGTRSASISSTAPVKSPRTERASTYNGSSDTSSVEESLGEPVSPASSFPRQSVVVRDTTSVISSTLGRDLGASPEHKLSVLASPDGAGGVLTPVAI